MTLCDLTQVKVNQQEQAVDSISFTHVLVHGYKFSPRHWLYTTMEAPNDSEKLGNEHAIRKGTLKLISLQRSVNGLFHRQLYDLSTDLMEERNLITKQKYKNDVKEMKERLTEYVGPHTNPSAPFCNLKYCGSARMLADEKTRQNTISTSATPVSSCLDQRTWASTTSNTQSDRTPTKTAYPFQAAPLIPGNGHVQCSFPLETSQTRFFAHAGHCEGRKLVVNGRQKAGFCLSATSKGPEVCNKLYTDQVAPPVPCMWDKKKARCVRGEMFTCLTCPKCGTQEIAGKGSVRTCCGPNAAWHGKCGSDTNGKMQYTWHLGVQACQCKSEIEFVVE